MALSEESCPACNGKTPALREREVQELLDKIPEWVLDGFKIRRVYDCKNYHETMAFVNASAELSHETNHHPELIVNYRTCEAVYWTHKINALSKADFICAAKLDEIYEAHDPKR